MLPASLKMMLGALPWLGLVALGELPAAEDGAACGASWWGFPERYGLEHQEQLQKVVSHVPVLVGFAQNTRRAVKAQGAAWLCGLCRLPSPWAQDAAPLPAPGC